LSLWSSLILFLTRNRLRELAPYATAVLLGFATFFGSLVVFLANPFQLLDPAPADGRKPSRPPADPPNIDPNGTSIPH